MKKNYVFYFLSVFLFFYVLINIFASQYFHPLFFKLTIKQNKTDALVFLKKIAKTKDYPTQLAVFTRIYGSSIKTDLAREKETRRRQIVELKALLAKNTNARDVLTKLALLYLEDGDRSKAKEYYQKAKGIDPEIKIFELEAI